MFSYRNLGLNRVELRVNSVNGNGLSYELDAKGVNFSDSLRILSNIVQSDEEVNLSINKLNGVLREKSELYCYYSKGIRSAYEAIKNALNGEDISKFRSILVQFLAKKDTTIYEIADALENTVLLNLNQDTDIVFASNLSSTDDYGVVVLGAR